MRKLFILFLLISNLPRLFGTGMPHYTDSIVNTIQLHSDKINNIEKSVDGVVIDLQHLEYAVSKQKDIIDQEQSAIENSLSASSLHLDIFAIILGIIGIALGIFITYKEHKIQKILIAIDETKNKVESTRERITELNNEINNKVSELYKRLRQEETTALLKRLVEVPLDIDNIIRLLLSRHLQPDDFDLLLRAYQNLDKEIPSNLTLDEYDLTSSKHNYLLLLFQQFCGTSLLHDELRDDIIKIFPNALESAFKRDVVNSLNSMIEVLNKNSLAISKVEILTKYLKALHRSRNKFHKEPYSIIVDNFDEFILQSVWNKLIEKDIVIDIFGNLLCEKYNHDEDFVRSVKEKISENNKTQSKKNDSKSRLDNKSK